MELIKPRKHIYSLFALDWKDPKFPPLSPPLKKAYFLFYVNRKERGRISEQNKTPKHGEVHLNLCNLI